MSDQQHATDFLAASKPPEPKPVCVLFADEAFLKDQVRRRIRDLVLPDEDAEFSYTEFEGKDATISDVREELATVAMFGGGKRLLVIRDADPFVTRYRTELENYVAKPRASSVLVLEVKTWPKNTRLAKAVASSGTPIDCAAPSEAKLAPWVKKWAKQRHALKVEPAAAELLVDFVGPELGLLDQELSKLALTVGKGDALTPAIVEKSVGSWRAKTTWVMLDSALAGDAPGAIKQLDRLLAAGETPLGLLAQAAFSLRRLAAATRIFLDATEAGRRMPLGTALEQAGIKRFVLRKSEEQLKSLGRFRGNRLLEWLLQADLDLKGDSRVPPREILERLIVKIASPELKSEATAAKL